MATTSKIEWTEQTWNPIVGCTKISAGCKHCYAETLSRRVRAMGTPGYENGFDLTGPIARGDEVTVTRQRAAVDEADPALTSLFDELATATRAIALQKAAA